ncbi:N-terminal Xaa-Pro-Lys N-methyltransferase 1 isoform X2 [Phycodurus eques]|uniref:N-terminal Xaa-Pro-Lys N-methyltransferase 1 isoform X2 n=1 Tax=Phycodurus eques TaxID=693459 RepID=UPI002ACEA13C|nr:N-terminal Xaa-Pro-Lys N-methyltransferase 1 isoform X2 [Phycodurus eques]
MGDTPGETNFYSNAEGYWKEVPPTVDGMLGGYGSISSIDINGSRAFLRKFLGEGEGKTSAGCALDCGAGIGRISKRLLLPLFKTADLVDVTQEFLDKAKTYLGEDGKRVGNYFCSGLQDFVPESGRYDVIWIQWVIAISETTSLSDVRQKRRAVTELFCFGRGTTAKHFHKVAKCVWARRSPKVGVRDQRQRTKACFE